MSETADQTLVRVETFDGRYYKVTLPGGRTIYLPSYTNVAGSVHAGFDALGKWRMEQSAELGTEGHRLDMFLRAKRGTAVHHGVELYNKGRIVRPETGHEGRPFDEEEWRAICRYDQWFRSVNAEVVATEMMIYWMPSTYSPHWEAIDEFVDTMSMHGFAGTLDAILVIDDPRTKKGGTSGRVTAVLDAKTSKTVFDEHKTQASCYMMAAHQMLPGIVPSDAIACVLALNTTTKLGYTLSVVDNASERQRRFKNRLRCYYDEYPSFTPDVDLLPAELTPPHYVGELVEEVV